ncbi:hypothetical protein GYM96_01510 [Pseudomonas fragi]|nr:hypothetical protein [Pseudomonas fragi]
MIKVLSGGILSKGDPLWEALKCARQKAAKYIPGLVAPPGLTRQAVLDFLLLLRQRGQPLAHSVFDHLRQHLLLAHHLLQFILDPLEGLLGQLELTHLQIGHGMQGGLVLLLVMPLQRGGGGRGEAAQAGQPGNIVAIALAQVLLISHPAHDLACLHSTQLGQAVEHIDTFFHVRRLTSWPII